MPQIAGLILAGGRASRMGGGDKCLLDLSGQTLLARIIARSRPQVGRLLLSANGDPARFGAYGLATLPDPVGDGWGPLAGILAGLEHLDKNWPDIPLMASFPGDSPFLPTDLVKNLADSIGGSRIAMAEAEGRLQPVFALWPVALAGELRQALLAGIRKVEQFALAYPLARRTWPAECFFNINEPEDLREAAARL